MGLPYETTFQFGLLSSESGGSGLDNVAQFLVGELSAGGVSAASDIEVETGESGAFGYAMIKTERPHPHLSEQLMQLEVRLCTTGDGEMQANFRSRFVSVDGVDPPELRAGPPRLLLSAMEQFDCSVGGLEFGRVVPVIDAGAVADFVNESVFGADRALPILVCSERPDGTIPLDPELVRRELLGLAQVARLEDEATSSFRELTGLACFNGAARWIWPGPRLQRDRRPPNSYLPQAALVTDDVLYNLQQTALQRALPDDFDGQYSICRTEVILERNRQLEAEKQSASAAEIASESQADVIKERRRANEFSRRLDIERRKVAQLDQQLAEALSRIEDIEAELDTEDDANVAYESARERRDEIRELRDRLSRNEKTITELNGELQRYRQEERNWIATNGVTLPIKNVHPGWLTICNHALNIYRDPMRRFVIGRLREVHGDDLERCVKGSVDFSGRAPYNAQYPESAIDVSDFGDLVQSNQQCFTNDQLQAHLLGDIRRFRNRVSHPPTNGLDESSVRDGLRNIRDALECIGEKDAASEVSGLTRLVRVS